MDSLDLKVEIARLQENVKTLKDRIEALYKKVQHLESENLKRGEESRDSYYIAEMTRKRFEEQFEIIKERIASFINNCDRHKCTSLEKFNILDKAYEKVKSRVDNLWLKIIGVLVAGLVAGIFTETRLILRVLHAFLAAIGG